MSYRLVRSPVAARQLKHLRRTHHPLHDAIVEAIKNLAHAPRPAGCVKLTSRPEWRIRIHDYRILYVVDDGSQLVTVVAIVHRREAYR